MAQPSPAIRDPGAALIFVDGQRGLCYPAFVKSCTFSCSETQAPIEAASYTVAPGGAGPKEAE